MDKQESLSASFRRFRREVPAQELGEGDGIDPKYEARKQEFQQGRDKPDYAAERLGSQMREALNVESLLPELDSFVIANVRQAGTSNTYTVQLYCSDPDQQYDPQAIVVLLKQNKGLLRHEIAQAITRKRVPELVFEVLPPGVQI